MSWDRVLWKKQPFPDNYVGDSFFRINKKCPVVDLSTAILGSTTVSQEICSCLWLMAVFNGLSEKQLSSFHLIIFMCLTTLLLYLFGLILYVSTKTKMSDVFVHVLNDLKVALFSFVLFWFLSPIIQTLTGSVATDTIMASTTFLLILHLVVHPYGANIALENPIMSRNLGVFASVCLASRLNSSEDVFALMITAVILFTLFPSFRLTCRENFGMACDAVTILIMASMTVVSLIYFASNLLTLMGMVLLVCNAVIPFLFVYMQPYRVNIYGPWDEAQIKET